MGSWRVSAVVAAPLAGFLLIALQLLLLLGLPAPAAAQEWCTAAHGCWDKDMRAHVYLDFSCRPQDFAANCSALGSGYAACMGPRKGCDHCCCRARATSCARTYGTIFGGAFGGAFLICVLVAVYLCLRRRRNQRRDEELKAHGGCLPTRTPGLQPACNEPISPCSAAAPTMSSWPTSGGAPMTDALAAAALPAGAPPAAAPGAARAAPTADDRI